MSCALEQLRRDREGQYSIHLRRSVSADRKDLITPPFYTVWRKRQPSESRGSVKDFV